MHPLDNAPFQVAATGGSMLGFRWIAASAGLIALAAAALALSLPRGPAHASVPLFPGPFSDSTAFTNPYMPFEPGAVKAYAGRSRGRRVAVIDLYLDETRDFDWDGMTVACVCLQETEFEDGELTEVSLNYFATADDGSVYYFGQLVDEYDGGRIVGHEESWLVGGGGPGDPPGTLTADDPTLFLPGTPEVGDLYRPENVFMGPQELAEIRKTGKRIRVTAGRFRDCIQVGETDVPDDTREKKFYAPGTGLIKAKGKREVLKLLASTLR